MHSSEEILQRLVSDQAGSAKDWFESQMDALATSGSERDLHIFLGLAPRKLGKADLVVTDAVHAASQEVNPGWDLNGWSIDGAARVLALLVFKGNRKFSDCFKDLRRTADVAELIALYRGLPLYPDPGALGFEVGEGLRSHMKSVFEAIAHNNPYPRDQFDEHRWNHMILKALFVESTLDPIVGLDERSNRELARIMREYAHERWAAGRHVSPELWRCVGPFAEDDLAIDDLKRALDGSELEAKAALLALSASPHLSAIDLVNSHALGKDILAGKINWADIAGELT